MREGACTIYITENGTRFLDKQKAQEHKGLLAIERLADDEQSWRGASPQDVAEFIVNNWGAIKAAMGDR